MPRVVHFEIAADDPDAIGRFYRTVFGWGVETWKGPVDYWLITTGNEDEPGINGAIVRREDAVARNCICPTIDVPSIERYIESVAQNGGKVVRPVTAVPGVGFLAYCADPEGTVFGIMERDPSA
ncbi:MAG: VOC family protein [Methanomicrobiales archaeon]|nr:VOC family protein [Methanomicrobiales archaeon]